MINNSTNIKKVNSHLLPQIIKYKNYHDMHTPSQIYFKIIMPMLSNMRLCSLNLVANINTSFHAWWRFDQLCWNVRNFVKWNNYHAHFQTTSRVVFLSLISHMFYKIYLWYYKFQFLIIVSMCRPYMVKLLAHISGNSK